ncbi:unnamed protein product [Mytilus coruscus]|uniref:Uncharacterized protein n=1 Tax=Mytilus coruscus TaxID=42192 RepID=A0A6J8BWQ8_MYTCO|nr:unnamed protein product [Mytilus coruscus]
MLDFLFYNFSSYICMVRKKCRIVQKNYKVLTNIESLQTIESSTFNIHVCKYHFASNSQYAAQILPPPKTINTNYNIRTIYHRHLQNGLQRDAVTGWLLYASFYYVTEQYNETIRLTEYVLSKCASDMVFLGKNYYSEADIDNYRHNVHPSIPLNVKMKTAVVDDVTYLQHSSLIPKELELEVEDGCFKIPPFTICHCLRFLCYHHIGDTFNKQQALCHLHSTYYMSTTVISNTLTLFGVCSEISGDKDEAVHCYDEALRCVFSTCSKRKSRLLNI